jgi:3-phenylpropionate/trans-cinnamate dioxygenase ferredoxin reductase component
MKPPAFDVVIAGGGLAAQRCCETLRRGGFDGSIAMLCGERCAPYDRPPLSKAVLTDGREPHPPRFKPPDWYEREAVELMLGHAAHGLDPRSRTIAVTVGKAPQARGRLRFGQLVIATGSRPRRLPCLLPGGPLYELRTHADALALRRALRQTEGPLVVLGAGLIGMEVAASARLLGRPVSMIEAAATPLARALPPMLGRWIAGMHREQGVDVRLATSVRRVRLRREHARLELSDGRTLSAAMVLLAAGTEPAVQWLAGSGLGPGAVATDAGGRTRLPGVLAAGDAASYPNAYLGRPAATQHWEAAARQGATVARSILGLATSPAPTPMFWSDQYRRRIQLVGHAADGCLTEIEGNACGGEPFAAWMASGGRPCAALLMDRPDLVPQARRWIAQSHAESPAALPHNAETNTDAGGVTCHTCP